jgi:archaellum biogenesis ATPase FlaH
MAKKNNSELSFKEMRTMMEGISKKTSIVIETEKKEFSYINTGIYMLNALLSKSILNGGVSKNRFTVFAGEESVGKSYLCYNIARNAQKEGYSVIYIDTEFSIELAELEDFGIDISEDNFMLIRSNKVEDLKMMISQFLDKLKEQKLKGLDISKTIIFLDSIGQLASLKETEDAIEGKNKADMSRAKAIKSLFRIITADLGFLEIPLVATNHIYMCVHGDTNIIMSDDTLKNVKELEIGDFVKTLDGQKEIENIFEYDDSPILKIELETGEIIKCTPNHKFLVTENWSHNENDACWKSASELTDNDYILSIK